MTKKQKYILKDFSQTELQQLKDLLHVIIREQMKGYDNEQNR